jgi:hypothetical protein
MASNTRRVRKLSPVPEIKLTRDVKLAIHWKELTSKLSEVIAQGFLTAMGGDGISGGISALIGSASSIKIEAPPGEKAWSLSVLCFAWALDELKTLPGIDPAELRAVMEDALADAKKEVDKGDEYVPLTFLDRPTTLPLYRALRDAIIARKATYRSGVHESDDALKSRFDAAYDRAMFEVFWRRSDLFQSLLSVFAGPTASAAERQMNWIAYRSRLVFEFEVRPVFGQETTKLSLSQLYVPLRACWPIKDPLPQDALLTHLSQTHNVAMLDDQLDRWVDSTAENDAIRLIGGGPGSGKSTTLRAFARRMANRLDWRTLFIPLQHIDLGGDLREAVNRYFVDSTSGSFTQPPLSRISIEDGPPLLLLFDGLDELARPGDAANEVVNLFSTKLTNLVSSLRGNGPKGVKVVASGRMPSFQAAKRYISPPTHGCLEVYGFTPPPEVRYSKSEGVWKRDQREMWWRQYAELVGAPTKIPPAFSSAELMGITHEPLLCYLLVLSGFATANWEQAAENPNRIYKTLVDSIWHRGWGEGAVKRQGPGRTLSITDFNVLMQTIALAAWQGGDTRVASEQGFANAVKIAQAENAWENFKNDNGPDITNLAMNFYLKAAESGQRGFEFTHKTFGDYLAARAILDVAEELPAFINRKVDHALTDWVIATGSGTLTKEVLNFMRNEVRLRATDDGDPDAVTKVIRLKASFERFVATIITEGLPASVGAPTWRVAETRQRNGEVMAWAVINALSLTLAYLGRDEKLVSVDWLDRKASFPQLISRIAGGRSQQNVALECFSHLVAPEADLFGYVLSGIDLRGAQMNGASFAGCHLLGANLEGASLEGCDFQRAMLDHARLDGASLKGADLSDAILATEMSRVNLEGAIITGASLLYVELVEFDSVPSLRRRQSTVMTRAHLREEKNKSEGDPFARVSQIRKILKLLPDANAK